MLISHTLRVQSPSIPVVLGQPALEPVRLSGREGVNSLFQYELWLKTPDALNMSATAAANFNLDDFIGREISCSIELDGNGMFVAGAIGAGTDRIGAGTREINALVTAAQFWGEEGRQVQYKLTLHPWLHLATLSTDCKVFQNQTVVEILDALLADYAFAVEKRLYERYPQRDYQVQYNESDFAFFERLCQEWGINYHFEHAEGKHRLVLSDAMAAFRPNASAAYQQVEYHPPGWKIDAEYIHAFAPEHHLTSGRYSTTDYDYTQPRADLSATRSDPRPTGHAEGEVYQWHADQGGSHYAQPLAGSPAAGQAQADRFAGTRDEAGLLTLLRMQQLRSAGARARVRGELSELDRMHLAQWQALRQALQANHLEGSPTAPAPAPADAAPQCPVPAPPPQAAPAPIAQPTPLELSDEELDALPPELPTPSFAPPLHKTVQIAHPESELTDEELDALPPELPQPEKTRKRVLPPPKKPPLSRL